MMTDPENTTPSAQNAQQNPKQNPVRKLLIELGPLLIFFAAYQFGGDDSLQKILTATGAFMAAMVAAMIASYMAEKTIAPMLWVTFAIVMVMGGLTLYFSDESFVKMKPTLVNGIFAAVLGFGLLRGQSYLKLVLESGFPPLTQTGWMVMTRNWALYFAVMAVLNEIVWRTQTTDMWVTIKTFGYLPLTLVFTFTQVPLIMKHQLEDKE